MSTRILAGEMRCLRIYLGENDKLQHKLVWKEILEKARNSGIAGCTMMGGMRGFGAGRRIHSDFPPDYAIDLPMLIEVVDESSRLDQFLEEVKPLLSGTLITEERALVHHYQPSHSPSKNEEV
jgi:PII-like signaling protein